MGRPSRGLPDSGGHDLRQEAKIHQFLGPHLLVDGAELALDPDRLPQALEVDPAVELVMSKLPFGGPAPPRNG